MKVIFNDIEKEVSVSLLLELMNADPGITDSKISYFQAIASELNISQTNFDNGKQLDPYHACNRLKNFTDDKKTILALIFRNMVHKDGEPSLQAINIINDITIRGRLGEALKKELGKIKK